MTTAKGNAVTEQPSTTATAGKALPAKPHPPQVWANWLQRVAAQGLGQAPTSAADPDAAWTALTHLARRKGFTVERAHCADADGFTTWRNKRIRIRPDARPAEAVTALAHQLGHVLLHGQIANLEPSGTVPCTGILKVEADSVAYLTAIHIGINDPAITFPRVSSWAGTDPRAQPGTTTRAATSRIHTAAATITGHLKSAQVTAARPTTVASARSPRKGQHAASTVPANELIRANSTAAEFFRSHMTGSWVPDYLARRGLSRDIQDHWLAGHAPASWDALTCHLRDAGYPDAVIEASGLARRSQIGTLIDTFRDRAMFPIRSPNGTIVAFIGRAAEHAAPTVPKYLNSPATSLYNKSQVLFGLWEARDVLANGARPVITEGPLDAIAVTIADQGTLAGVSPCGTAFSTRHAAALNQAADLPSVGVTVAFDPDKAGRRAAIHAYHQLIPLTDKLAAATLPPGHDPAKILADSGPDALATILTDHRRPLPDLVINTEVASWSRRLSYPEGQIHALRAAAPLIAAMPPAHVARQVARLAAILRLDHATVTEAVTDALTELIAHPDSRGRNQRAAGQATLSRPPVRAANDDIPHNNGMPIDHSPVRGEHRNANQPELTRRQVPRPAGPRMRHSS